MNRALIILALTFPLAAGMCAPSVIGLLPEDKAPIVLAEEERNPFGKRVVKAVAEAAVQTESEELKIRSIIEKLPLGGLTRGYGVTKVLLGSFTIQEGELIPDVIPYQTEKVKVLAVSGDKIVLGFVDKDGSAETRKMTLLVNLKPTVRFMLGVKADAEPKEADASLGVSRQNESGSSR